MKKSRTAAFTALAATTLALSACSGAAEADAPGNRAACPSGISIGFLGSLTGANRNLTVNAHSGAQLAVEEHNARSGACKVTLTDFDTLGEATRAETAADQAIADPRLVGIVGPGFSSEAAATGQALADAGLVTVSPTATNGTLTSKGWKTFFRVVNSDWTQGPTAAAFMTKTLGKQHVFVVDDGSAYGRGMTDVFRRSLGTASAGYSSISPEQVDYRQVVAQVQASGADAVFYGGYYTEAGRLVAALRAAGLDQERLTFVTDDGAKDPAFITTGGAATDGAYVTCSCLPPEKGDPAFLARYSKAYGAPPGTFAAEGYDAATVLLAGIDAGKTTRADLLSFVRGYQGTGVSKDISFTPQGDVTVNSVWTYRVQDGQLVANKIITASDG